MNLVLGDDIRDTTTPAAMARVMSTFLVGDYLKPASREKLISWMIDTRTGLKRLRAGFPADWLAGDKTGTGMAPNMPDTYVDVAIAWPPRRAPLIVTAYYNATTMDGDIADAPQAVLADVARLATAWLTSGSQ